MGNGFYAKLAVTNIRKNRRLYIPQIFTGAGLTAVFYIMLTICRDDKLSSVRGGRYLPSVMIFGVIVMAVLSVILILYTNSFLMKQRKREFGLYNVLGMEKKHVGRIMMFETIISSVSAIIVGLLAGVILYKICLLLICRIMGVDTILGFYYIVPKSILTTGLLFAGLYFITYLFNRIQLARMKTVDLLKSVHVGEKEPKVKWPIFIIGLITMGAGYYMALTLKDPTAVIFMIFIAIALVIVGTYCLFTAGSIAFLKALKKNNKFYYHPKHMTAVSGLLYRMKQNAVGLASICILVSGVLVLVSTTVSLYAGMEDTLNEQYPHDLLVSANYDTDKNIDTGKLLQPIIKETIEEAAKEKGLTISDTGETNYCDSIYEYDNGAFKPDTTSEITDVAEFMSKKFAYCILMSEEEYTRLTGNRLELSDGQAACWMEERNGVIITDNFQIEGKDFVMRSKLPDYPILMSGYESIYTFGFVFSQYDFDTLVDLTGDDDMEFRHEVWFDFENTDEEILASAGFMADKFDKSVNDVISKDTESDGACSYRYMLRADGKEEVYGLNGSLLFLGIILGIVFMFGTILIIYYKQISEGYEDRERFQIMRKVGMSHNEVKRSIRSQVLLVFFLPLVAAGIHIAVIFPMLTRLLKVLSLTQTGLFLLCTVIVYVIFAVIYIIIYALTAKTYYKIVS